MKKTKISLLCLFLAAAVACSASACGNGGGATGNDTSNTISVSNTGSSKYSADNDTKVKQMLDSVTLNGKPLKIPYKLSDLGEGYTFDENVRVYDNKYAITTLMYNGTEISTVTLTDYFEGQKASDFVAVSIDYSFSVDSSVSNMLNIDGITGSSSMEEVYNTFGEPTTKETASMSSSYYYRIDENCYVSFIWNDKGIISKMTAHNKGEN